MTAGIVHRFRARLPLPDKNADAVSLGEGATPLIPLVNIAPANLKLFAKFEGMNPTGSFKDRGMAAAVTAAKSAGAKALICASTGNTSASASAYAARAGMKCLVLIPSGKIAAGKLAQAVAHGAIIIEVAGNFDDAMRMVKEVGEEKVTVVNSINPMRLQGQKTAAFEIIQTLGRAPDIHALPVGNAGNITAHWIGYSEAANLPTRACEFCSGECLAPGEKLCDNRPRMLGYQAAGAAPFLQGGPVKNPETVATAIRIGNPQSFNSAKAAVAESGGAFRALEDSEILQMQKRLASEEGIFCEPASASAMAGAIKDFADGNIAKDSVVVCTLTGHGLKDTDAIAIDSSQFIRVNADSYAMRKMLDEILQ